MKILVSGKGGVGKTTVAAIIARLLARGGSPVLAVDADGNPNLAIALGMGASAVRPVRNAMLRLAKDERPTAKHDIEGLLAEFGIPGPDGITLVETCVVQDHPEDGCLACGSREAFRDLFARAPAVERVVVADLEAGVNDLLWAYPKPEDVLVIVTDPSRKSLEVGARLRHVASELKLRTVVLVVNQLERPDDLARARSALPDLPMFAIPDDASMRAADRDGRSPLDVAPDTAAVTAVRELAGYLVAQPAA